MAGMPITPQPVASMPRESRTTVYGRRYFATKACTSARLSLIATPTTLMPGCAAAKAATSAASAAHEGHHEAKKLTTVGLPRVSARSNGSRCSVLPLSGGEGVAGVAAAPSRRDTTAAVTTAMSARSAANMSSVRTLSLMRERYVERVKAT